jgi:hypothetical protein
MRPKGVSTSRQGYGYYLWMVATEQSLSVIVIVHTERLHEEICNSVEQMEHHPERPEQCSRSIGFSISVAL